MLPVQEFTASLNPFDITVSFHIYNTAHMSNYLLEQF